MTTAFNDCPLVLATALNKKDNMIEVATMAFQSSSTIPYKEPSPPAFKSQVLFTSHLKSHPAYRTRYSIHRYQQSHLTQQPPPTPIRTTMNSTIDTTGPAQTYETTFNISDYVNFDFDFDAPHESFHAPSDICVAHPSQSMVIHDPYVDFIDAADTEFANTFQPPSDCNVLGNVNATQAASEGLFTGDAIQTALETDASHDDFSVLESTAFAQTIGSGARETISFPSKSIFPLEDVIADILVPSPSQIMQDPSIWLPVSPQLQQHLNIVYASDLVQQLNVPNPAPVLFFPAVEPFGPPTSSIQSPPNDVHTRYIPPSTPLPEIEITSISPTLLMHESPTLLQDFYYNCIPSQPTRTSDNDNVEDSASEKRTLDTNETDPEPASKRTKTAQAESLPTLARDDDTDDDDEPEIISRRTTRQIPLPITAKKDDFVGESNAESESDFEDNRDDRFCDSASSGSLSAPSSPPLPPTPVVRAGIPAHPRTKQAPTHGPNWRYEKAQEVRLREQRRKEWKQKRTNPLGVRGKAPSRKMQKLLEEIEDSEGFAEAHGYRVEEGVGSEENRGSVCRRPVRKGARKSYVGQE